ncbi:MAG: bifunctional diaminohydroxyphosphoribosylaminopyrimidine deaminase/5-amino-6-(5-phosphoribosylamino)uracil reductase RibD [Chloroflexi bacterium]|nr:bifunctional diaminohydroxyphosphoribosylaminopyrimidine deaminase/5-amino-6-(5-phosphoribosylamino)uracil reductase RibD [Chloroflexota bacterium]
MHEFDAHACEMALTMAESVRGTTSPNPAVGAVVVRNGHIIATGATQPPGHAHAERVALAQAGAAARGADLYVTLEPCTFQGRTPACTDAIIESGIRHVYYMVNDRDPRMGVGAAATLATHGIGCSQIRYDDARVADTLAPFFMRLTRQRPYMTLKYAMSLDGKIATQSGISQWISGSTSRMRVHQMRAQVDAVLTASGTALHDNPQLTVRLDTPLERAQPTRVLFDSRGRTPITHHMFNTTHAATIVVCTEQASQTWVNQVKAQGVVVIQQAHHGQVTLHDALSQLATRGINHCLVEAGSTFVGALNDAHLIDEIHAFIAPGVIGHHHAPGPIAGKGINTLTNWHQYVIRSATMSGEDVHIHAIHHHAIQLQQLLLEGKETCSPVS